ncbi:GBA, partial [Symbiodinium necroappetens]
VPILKKYGYEESLRGVMEMRAQTRLLAFDIVVLKLLRDIHGMLEAQKPLPQPVQWRFEPGWRPMPCHPHSLAVEVVQTCRDTGDRMQVKEPLPLTPDFDFQGTTIRVDIQQSDQVILGFGGAFTEASALVFQGLHPDLQKEVLELYFGDLGIGYSLGRVHINSCDFSMGNYSFDDIPEDHDLVHFDYSLARDAKAVIPMIRGAQKLVRSSGGKLRLMASPWSPPAWMKMNGAMNGSHSPGLREDCRDAWARYFASWIDAYKQHGIQIWAVSVQNEPEHNAPWEACCYTAGEEAAFIAGHLGPTLQALHPEVGIFAFDHNKDHVHDWACQLFRDQAAVPFVRGIAFHWYAGDHFEKVRHTHEDFPSAVLLPSEACYERHRWKSGSSLLQGDWSFGEGYAHDIMGDLNAGGAGWIDWNLLLNEDGGPNHVGNVCDAPLIASLTEQQIHLHPQFFFLGHFAKYIRPGSKRLLTSVRNTPRYMGATRRYGTCSAQDGLQAAAFVRPDGLVATVVLNAADLPVSFKLQMPGCGMM